MKKITRALTFAVLCGTALSTTAAQTQEFYEGETLTLVLGSGAGGGQDVTARLFAEHWADHIPGQPNIVIRNLTGGGGTNAMNFIANSAPADGFTAYWGQYNPVGTVIEDPTMAGLDFTTMNFIGALGSSVVNIVRSDALGDPEQPLESAMEAENLRLGGVNPLGILDLTSRLGLDIMGVDYTFVPGYGGVSATAAAFLQNEVQITTQSQRGYLGSAKANIVDESIGVPLWYYPAISPSGTVNDNPELSDLPNFVDAYETIHGEAPSGPEWEAFKWLQQVSATLSMLALLPEGAPDEAVIALRDGFQATLDDDEFQQAFIDAFGAPVEYGAFEDNEETLHTYTDVSQDVIDVFKRYGNL